MKIMDGAKIRNELLMKQEEMIKKEKLDIKLAIIEIGEDSSSNLYIKNKMKYTSKVGIKTELYKLDVDISESELINLIKKLNEDRETTGILLQAPVPPQINFTKCVRFINPDKDVDGLSTMNLLGIYDYEEKILPCTVKGILRLLEYYNIELEGKNIVIIGRSKLVGRPLFDAFLNRNATVTLCHSKTKNLADFTLKADIIVSTAGCANLIRPDMVSSDFIGIDVGINVINKQIVGDFSEEACEKASYMTPVPGGVGPMTIAMLIENLIELKKLSKRS